MSIVSSKLPLLDKGRKKVEQVGLRPTRVFICKRVYASGVMGKGPYDDVEVEIGGPKNPRPLVTEIGAQRGLAQGLFRIERITPFFGAGGWTKNDLVPTNPGGSNVWVRLDGPFGRDRRCKIVDVDLNSAFNIILTVEDRS
jgi:hypothetical protein